MRSFFATLRQLVLPAGAPPGTPRIVLGPDVPATLAAFSPDFVFSSAIVFYYNATDYYFESVAIWVPIGTQVVIKGTYDTTNGVIIYEFIRLGFNELAFGSATYNTVTPFLAIRKMTLSIENTSPFTIDGVSAPRGVLDYVAGTVNSGALGAEAVYLTGNSRTFIDGHAYRISVRTNVTTAIGNAANAQVIRVRVGNIAGTVERTWVQRCIVGGSEAVAFSFVAARSAGSNLTTQLVVTGQGITNTWVADVAGNSPYEMQIEDVGAAVNYPNCNVLV